MQVVTAMIVKIIMNLNKIVYKRYIYTKEKIHIF